MKKLIVLALLFAATSIFAQGGGPRPKFIVQPTSLQFGTVSIGDSLDRVFTIRVDTAQHSDVDVSLSAPHTSVFRIVSATSFTVNQGTTDTVRIRFKPTGGQLFRDTIWATHNGDTAFSKNPTRITMSGSGPDTLVHITINTQFINFPTTNVGQTSTRTVAITNTSFVQKQLTGTAVIAKTPTPYAITSGGTISQAQGTTDSLKLSFTPSAAGQAIDTLIITSNAGATGSTISKILIFGMGAVPDTLPKMTVIYPQGNFFSLNYGQVTIGKNLERTIKLVNTSDSSITLKLTGTSSLWKGNEYSFTSGGGTFNLARKDTQEVVIRFTPDSVGMLRDTLLVTNNSSTPLTKIPITGQGVAPSSFPKIQFGGLTGGQGNRLSFGQTDTIGIPVVRTFTIRNSNSDIFTTLTGSVGLPTKPQFVVTSGVGAFSLDSGLSKTIEVTLIADAVGPITDTLIVTSNDSTRLTFKVALNGNGVSVSSPSNDTPIIRINRTIFDFGNITKGAAEQSIAFAITNSSTVNKQLIFSLESPTSPFRLSSSGSFTLNQGERKTDTMYFSTQTVGNFTDSLVVISNTSEQTKRMVIQVKGNILENGSVHESKLISSTSVYPNPAFTLTTVQFTLAHDAEIEAMLFDTKGVQLRHFESILYPSGSNSLQINCSYLAVGMYYLQINTTDGSKVVPIAVVK